MTDGRDEEALSRGVHRTYTEENFRYSQTVPLTMYDERNSGNNLPAQIDVHSARGDEYRFLFVAKGGGSRTRAPCSRKRRRCSIRRASSSSSSRR